VILDELPPAGIQTEFVTVADGQWIALSRPATAVFFESPSNPMQDLVDVAAVCELAHAAGAQVIVDNVFATPLLQRPLELGADIVVYSATKHIDGQGRVLGGAILGPEEYIDEKVQLLMRHTGPSMSPFNAWVLLKGLETLRLRLDRQCEVALQVAGWLERHPRVRSVRHPFPAEPPAVRRRRRQMSGAGASSPSSWTARPKPARSARSPSWTGCAAPTSPTTSATRSPWSRTRPRPPTGGSPRRRGPRRGSPTP
jgi:O-succinylhomoserine sulfhydrylase